MMNYRKIKIYLFLLSVRRHFARLWLVKTNWQNMEHNDFIKKYKRIGKPIGKNVSKQGRNGQPERHLYVNWNVPLKKI